MGVVGVAIRLVIIVIFSLVFGACGKVGGPLGPTEPMDIVFIPAQLAPMSPGGTQEFSVTGGDNQNFSFIIEPPIAGVVSRTSANISNRFTLVAGTSIGTFNLKVTSGGKNGIVQFEVKDGNFAKISNMSPGSGASLQVGQTITFTVSYVTDQKPTAIFVSLIDITGVPIPSNGGTPVYGNQGGTIFISVSPAEARDIRFVRVVFNNGSQNYFLGEMIPVFYLVR